jgi:hypothetical protein
MRIWLVRAVWITLPLTAGPALQEGLRAWSHDPATVGAALCWLGWGVGVLATLAPRPLGLTALRAVAPGAVVAAIAATASGHPSTLAAVGALVATVAAAVLVADPAFAMTAANAVAYGDERRYPLRVPPALFAGPLPLARAVLLAGLGAGPLLLAEGSIAAGAAATVVGVPLAIVAARVLQRLSRRWLVLVPAGLVVVDRLTLADNVLFPREHVVRVRPLVGDERTGDALDLRLGATLGSLLLEFDEPAELLRAVRPGRGAETVDAPGLLVAAAHRRELLGEAARRRVRVELVDPLPRPSSRRAG